MSELHTWLAEEAALRQRWQQTVALDGARWRERLPQMDGMAQLQALLRGEAPPPSIGRTLDFLLMSAEPGRAVFQGTPGPGHLNPMGGVHGGWYASILDSALGCSVHTKMPAGRGYTTLELKLNMIRALKPTVQRVRAIGAVIHVGNQTATAEARLVGPDGKLYAHATTTCLVFALPSSHQQPGNSHA
ncbi:MAG: PaaI family thioesterase [Pseudomonadota bacterium]|nr:PaaI family thioesterase [Pseudomonadota bacterium]